MARTCSIPECGGRHVAKGYCRKHYMRQWNNGTLELQTATGEKHGAAKLSADDVARIRAEHPGFQVASEQYGIGKTQYHRIIRGEVWR